MMASDGVCQVDEAVKFNNLCSNFTTLFHGRSRGDRQHINSLLDDFNSLDFKSHFIKNPEKALLVVNQCCSIVPTNDTFLVAKGCQLINNLITKQKVKVEGKTLLMAINWCLEAARYCSDIAILDILGALEVLLFGNGCSLKLSYNIFSENSTLMLLADNKDNDVSKRLSVTSVWDVRLYALRCLQAATYISDANADDHSCVLEVVQLEKCASIFLSYLFITKKSDQTDLNYVKIMNTCLQGIQNVFCQSKQMLVKFAGDAVGVVKAYMLYGLPGHTDLMPQKIFPSILAQADLRPSSNNTVRQNKNAKVKLRNPRITKKTEPKHRDVCKSDWKESYSSVESVPKLKEESTLVGFSIRTSESEYSDSEAGQAAKIRSFQGRVRQGSQGLLQTIIKVMDKKLLFGYLSSFLPDGTTQTRTLMTCLLRDPSPNCRIEVINSLSAIFQGSKIYFLQGERSGKNSTSFIPHSESVGITIEELHRSMCLALSAENSVPVIIQLLKCLARLVQTTPYHRLSQGLVMKVVRNARAFLRHKDCNVQVASLNVLRSVICIEPMVPDILENLKKPFKPKWQKNFALSNDSAAHVEESESAKEDTSGNETDSFCEDDSEMEEGNNLWAPQNKTKGEVPWLLEISLENLGVEFGKYSTEQQRRMDVKMLFPVPVRVESFQVISALCRFHFIPLVLSHLHYVREAIEIGFTDSDTSILFHAGRLIEAVANALLQCIKQEHQLAATASTAVDFWKMMLSGPIPQLTGDPKEAALRTAGCDCLANMTSDIFEELPRDRQTLVIALLFGCSADEETNVRAAAVRALTVYILFPELRRDVQFVMDTSESVIKALTDPHVGTRMKASWSLSNVTDALVINATDEEAEDIPKSLLTKILQSAIKAARDNERVRSSAVRAIGNILRILSIDILSDQMVKENVGAAIKALIQNASTGNNMKIRWNACYAIGNFMRNRDLYTHKTDWQASVFHVLLELVQNFRNFKVRISAATALAAPSDRVQYGSHYISIWTALINALENSRNMEDYSEYQHQDNLVEQICHALIHLAGLVSVSDLVPLEDVVVFNIDILQQNFIKFQRNVVPEKTAKLTVTADHLSTFLNNDNLNNDQKRSASLLATVFSVESESF